MLALMALLPCCHVKENRTYLFGDVVVLFSSTVEFEIGLISYSRCHVNCCLMIIFSRFRLIR